MHGLAFELGRGGNMHGLVFELGIGLGLGLGIGKGLEQGHHMNKVKARQGKTCVGKGWFWT